MCFKLLNVPVNIKIIEHLPLIEHLECLLVKVVFLFLVVKGLIVPFTIQVSHNLTLIIN